MDERSLNERISTLTMQNVAMASAISVFIDALPEQARENLRSALNQRLSTVQAQLAATGTPLPALSYLREYAQGLFSMTP